MRYLILEIFIAVTTILVLPTVFYHFGKAEGVEQGIKKALSTNPVSQELETTCVALWVGDQNKKAWQKENK